MCIFQWARADMSSWSTNCQLPCKSLWSQRVQRTECYMQVSQILQQSYNGRFRPVKKQYCWPWIPFAHAKNFIKEGKKCQADQCTCICVFFICTNANMLLTAADPTTVVDASPTGWIPRVTGSSSATMKTRKQQHTIVQRPPGRWFTLSQLLVRPLKRLC